MSDFSIIRDGAFEASMKATDVELDIKYPEIPSGTPYVDAIREVSGAITWEPTPEWDRWWKLQVVIRLRDDLLLLARMTLLDPLQLAREFPQDAVRAGLVDEESN
jgi:hypothetical protein